MRTPYQARAFIRSCIRSGQTFPKNECLMRCHDAYDIPTDGTPYAFAAWEKARHKFYHQWIPGSFAHWAKMVNGVETGPGHVAITAFRKGIVLSTDLKFLNGRMEYTPGQGWGRVPLLGVQEIWPDHRFLGFTLDVDGRTPQSFPRIRRSYP